MYLNYMDRQVLCWDQIITRDIFDQTSLGRSNSNKKNNLTHARNKLIGLLFGFF